MIRGARLGFEFRGPGVLPKDCRGKYLRPSWFLCKIGLRLGYGIAQGFSAFLMLGLFNTVPHVVVTPNHKVIFVAT